MRRVRRQREIEHGVQPQVKVRTHYSQTVLSKAFSTIQCYYWVFVVIWKMLAQHK